MKQSKHIFLCLCTAVLMAACTTIDNTAAIVNGTKITKQMYAGTLSNLILQQKQTNPNFVDNEQSRLLLGKVALEQLITNEVLAQQAAKANIRADKATVEQNIEILKQSLAVDANGQRITDPKQIDKNFQEKLKADGITLQQLKKNIRKELDTKLFLNDLSSKQKVQLTEDVLHRFYDATMLVLSNDKNKIKTISQADVALIAPFAAEVKKATSPRASVSAIFLATPKTLSKENLSKKQDLAKKIVQELKNKRISFVEAIQKYSDDKNALRSNGEQLVLKDTLPANLDKKVFESSLGKVEGPITEADGIYILRVNEKRAEIPLTYEQLRGDIIKYLGAFQIKQNVQKQVKDLVDQAKVEILLPQYKVRQSVKDKNEETKEAAQNQK